MNTGSVLLLALVLGTGAARADQDNQDVGELRTLVEEQQYEAAWELGMELRFDHEGEARFDFYFGLAALETGRYSEAVFALERVLMRQPGSQRTRLELARTYFLLEENNQARREFERVLAQEPPEQVRATVERYLVAIQRREERFEPIYSYWVEAGGGQDSNVNSGPDEFYLWDVLRVEDAEATSDTFMDVNAGGEYLRPITEEWAWFGRARLANRFHASESDHDNRRLRVDGGMQWMKGPVQARAGLDLQRYWRAGETYQDQLGLQGSGRYRLNPLRDVTGFLRLSRTSHPDNENSDGRMWTLGGGLSQRFAHSMQPRVSGTLFLGNQDPRQSGDVAKARADREMMGAQVNGQATVVPEVVLKTSLQYVQSEYGANEFAGYDPREETLMAVEISADWRLDQNWRVTPAIDYTDNRANEDIYEFDRTQISVTARHTFD
ncbi:MAG: porin family protein [Thiohalospira sp.]